MNNGGLSSVRFGVFIFGILYRFFSKPFFFNQFIKHSYWITSRCFLPVMAVIVPTGMTLALQGANIFRIFGTDTLVSSLIAVTLMRELCPAMTGMMMAAQAGSSIAVELGTMRIREEIDAMEVMAIDSIRYLLVPRIAALSLVCPCITTIGLIAGIWGGWVVGVKLMGINSGHFQANAFMLLQPFDIPVLLIKSTLFGFIIGCVSCYKGYTVQGGAAQVGKAANNSVLISIVVYLIFNFVISDSVIRLQIGR